MLPAYCIPGALFELPPCELMPDDVEGFVDELRRFHVRFRHCCGRSEPRDHFFATWWASSSPLNGNPSTDCLRNAGNEHSSDATYLSPERYGVGWCPEAPYVSLPRVGSHGGVWRWYGGKWRLKPLRVPAMGIADNRH